MTVNAHIDRQKGKTIDGVTFTNTHSGQKRAYGDSFYDYDVTSDLPADEVRRVCTTHVYKCDLSAKEYQEQYQATRTADAYFKSSYIFRQVAPGKFFYQVTFPYTD